MKKSLLFLCIIVFVFSSCNKYEYGPSVSLRTKTGRIANEWKIEKALKNGVEATAALPRFEITFNKNGDVLKIDSLISGLGNDSVIARTGLWQFDRSSENVLLLFRDNATNKVESSIWRILKLTNYEFWFEEQDSIDVVEYHLKVK